MVRYALKVQSLWDLIDLHFKVNFRSFQWHFTYFDIFIYIHIPGTLYLLIVLCCLKIKVVWNFFFAFWPGFYFANDFDLLYNDHDLLYNNLDILKKFPINIIINKFLNRYEPIHIKSLTRWQTLDLYRYLDCIMALHWTVTHRSWPDEVTFIGFFIYNRI